jgi:hypothetical protein
MKLKEKKHAELTGWASSGPTGPLPPSASLHACMRARLADGDCDPGWPLPANGYIDEA